ncbi:MAG: C40 family peptidase [Coriobacteriales bacterium]|jgi:cell wall-associated NlpC family hydrolase|nr:C40 family peptidase [Coriobacteriales bacterium]
MPDTPEATQTESSKIIAMRERASLSRRMFLGASVAAAAVIGSLASRPLTVLATPTSVEKQAEADQVRAKLDDWARALDDASNRYYDALDAHDAAIASMEEAKARRQEAEAQITDLQSRLGSRAASMYKRGQFSFFEVLLGAHSFSEFTSSWDLLNSINYDDAAMIERCKDAKLHAQEAHEEYAIQEQIAQRKLDEAEEIRKEAEETLAAYQAELDSLEAEILELIEQERKAEEERLAAEARAAAEAAAGAGRGNGNWVGDSGKYDEGTYGSIVEAAYSRLGYPYIWAANGPYSFDCSGLTSWCYRQVGLSIPRGGNAQFSSAPIQMPVSEAQPGDILWMWNHVGIYIGGGQYIHAPQSGDVVRIAGNMGMWQGASRWY